MNGFGTAASRLRLRYLKKSQLFASFKIGSGAAGLTGRGPGCLQGGSLGQQITAVLSWPGGVQGVSCLRFWIVLAAVGIPAVRAQRAMQRLGPTPGTKRRLCLPPWTPDPEKKPVVKPARQKGTSHAFSASTALWDSGQLRNAAY
jgi:hypothetical protein